MADRPCFQLFTVLSLAGMTFDSPHQLELCFARTRSRRSWVVSSFIGASARECHSGHGIAVLRAPQPVSR